jgi:hypothetical protein
MLWSPPHSSLMNQSDTDLEPLLRLATSVGDRVRNMDPEHPESEVHRIQHLLEEVAGLLPAVDETATRHGLRSVVPGLRGHKESSSDVQDQPVATPPHDGFAGLGECIGLPNVLNFLGLLGKTGRLTVNAEDEVMSLDFEGGKLVSAWSDHAPPGQRLGEILVTLGILKQGHLDSFLTNYTRASGWMGEALEREGLVTSGQLLEAVRHQTQHLFHRLFELQECWFTFVDGAQSRPDGAVAMNVNALLLESARQSDERAA